MLQPKSRLGPKSAPEISPDRRQTERTQVAQKTLRKNSKSKAYNNRFFHSLFILIKLIFKTVNGRRVHDIKRKAVPVIYSKVVLKEVFFNLRLCPLVIELLSTANKCSNDGWYPFNTL